MRWSLPRTYRTKQTLQRENVHMEIEENGTSCMFIFCGGERYGLCVLRSCCRQKTLGHGSRVTQWLGSLHHVQELPEPEPLVAETEFVSSAATRAAKLISICSTFCNFAKQMAAVQESVWNTISELGHLARNMTTAQFV